MSAVHLGFHITNRCQLNCDHCLRDPEKNAVELELELIARVVDEVRKSVRLQDVIFTGGEPTLHARFADVVDAVARRAIPWQIVSNGATMPRLMAMLAAEPTWMDSFLGAALSLDGADEAVHDAIRGPGSFQQVLQAASLLRAMGKRLRITTTINRRNQHQIQEFCLLAARLGAESILFATLYPTGTMLDRTLSMTPDEWRQARERIDSMRRIVNVGVRLGVGWPTGSAWEVCSPWKFEEFHVDIYGRLNLCCVHSGIPYDGNTPVPPDVAGDLRRETFLEAWPRLVTMIHELMQRRIAAMTSGTLSEQDMQGCNWCLKSLGRPHWTADGVGGPVARRERWTGAWTPGYKESHVEAGMIGPVTAQPDTEPSK
jgi:MoaA/NifB/PqqE/SkfB family radical SAM enzyme